MLSCLNIYIISIIALSNYRIKVEGYLTFQCNIFLSELGIFKNNSKNVENLTVSPREEKNAFVDFRRTMKSIV